MAALCETADACRAHARMLTVTHEDYTRTDAQYGFTLHASWLLVPLVRDSVLYTQTPAHSPAAGGYLLAAQVVDAPVDRISHNLYDEEDEARVEG